MKINPKQISVMTTVSFLAFALLVLSFANFGGIPRVAAVSASSDCTIPTAPTGSLPTLNSTFTLTVSYSYYGNTRTFNQNTIAQQPSCWSYGGFVAHASGGYLPDDYGNYTGVPVSYLVSLVDPSFSPGQTVQVISGTDGYTTTYTYSEVMSGTGWGNIFNTAVCGTAGACSSSSAKVSTSPPTPMYLVLAYLWNGSDIGAYACVPPATTPCPSGPVNGGNGPLRTVTINPSGSPDPTALTTTPGYLIGAGGPWNKGVTVINILGTPSSSVPEFGVGTGVLAGTAIALALGFVALFAVRGSYLSRLRQQAQNRY